jgi:nicotinate-nucleotide adenylyltransferase
MLCLATENEPEISVSKMEIEMPELPYSVETLTRLNVERPQSEIYFVMGADSWMEITAWREWEKVLSLSNHIVVSRPGVEIGFSHVTEEIRRRIIDLRSKSRSENQSVSEQTATSGEKSIYITDSVNLDISATEIRRKIRDNDASWLSDVPAEVANYIEKYQIYS